MRRLNPRFTVNKPLKKNKVMVITKKKKLTYWDWTTLVAAWRYYEHRQSIASSMFPHEIVARFFVGKYNEESCRQIARQFVEIDHKDGPDDELNGWIWSVSYSDNYSHAWRLFYFYLKAYLYGFAVAKVTSNGNSELVKVFRADGKWYSQTEYERFGEIINPYKDSEIKFD